MAHYIKALSKSKFLASNMHKVSITHIALGYEMRSVVSEADTKGRDK